jgi:hypothetical protein
MDRERCSPQLKRRSGGPIKGQGIGARAPMYSDALPDPVRLSAHLPG